MTDIGIKVKELRKEKELSQKQLASQIYIAQNSLSQIETSTAKPSLEVLVALADALECSVDYLLGREDDFGNINVQSSTPALSTEEQRLLNTFRKLNTKNRIHVSAYANIRLEEQAAGDVI